MTRYLLVVDFRSGPDDTPMEQWEPEEVEAHLDYYRALNGELEGTGELTETTILTGPDLAKVVTSDGTRSVVTDGPFPEIKEWVAGYQIVDVENEARALEIAARVSAVPGRGGTPTAQPIQVRRIMEDGPGDAAAMDDFLATVTHDPH